LVSLGAQDFSAKKCPAILAGLQSAGLVGDPALLTAGEYREFVKSDGADRFAYRRRVTGFSSSAAPLVGDRRSLRLRAPRLLFLQLQRQVVAWIGAIARRANVQKDALLQ